MIAIIAMLAAIVSVAVVRGLDTAKQTRIKTEVDQLDAAFKAYKEKYGAYPPCDLRSMGPNVALLRQHVARAFPRYNLNELDLDLSAAGIDPMPMNFRPDQALVFWLRGFSSDPLHPFVTLNDNPITMGMPDTAQKVKRTPLFDFDTTRLVSLPLVPGTDTMPSYFPAGVNVASTPSTSGMSPFAVWSGGGAPYLYWDAPSYQVSAPMAGGSEAVPVRFNQTGLYANAGVAAPYWLDANQNGLTAATADFDMNSPPQPTEKWVNPESFQIIATGMDGRYGAVVDMNVRCYPTGRGYDTSADLADDDNLTNFCAKARLGDAKP